MGRVLAIVYRTLATHQRHKAGHTRRTASTGAVTLIQRFGSALNLNLHLTCMDVLMPRAHGCAGAAHMLLLDGVYVAAANRLRFKRVQAPGKIELEALVRTICERVGRHLEREGLLVRDLDTSYLALEPHDDEGLAQVLGSSITYRIALGPRQGHQAFTLQTRPAQSQQDPTGDRLAKASGFSLHAGVATEPSERKKLERLCRYITRPALSQQRLSLTSQGWVRYALKTPWPGWHHPGVLRAARSDGPPRGTRLQGCRR